VRRGADPSAPVAPGARGEYLIVDGCRVEGTLVPPAAPGSRVCVEAVIP
jgi:hypothetical protein